MQWKYKSDGTLTVKHLHHEQVYKGVKLFQISGFVNKFLISINRPDLVKNGFNPRKIDQKNKNGKYKKTAY